METLCLVGGSLWGVFSVGGCMYVGDFWIFGWYGVLDGVDVDGDVDGACGRSSVDYLYVQ